MKKGFLVLLILLMSLTTVIALSCSCGQRSPETPATDETPGLVPIVDSDGDGYSDEFEINVAKTDPSVPNERYALLINTLLIGGRLAETHNFGEKEMERFLVEKERVPPENIIKLLQLEAASQNVEKTLNQFAEKIDGNDLFYLFIGTHGVGEGVVFYRQGITEEWKTSPPEREKSIIFSYWQLDQYLDKIKARAMIVMIHACYTEEDTLYNALRDKSRIIVGTNYGGLLVDFLEALGTEITPEVSWRYVFGKPAPEGSFNIGTEDNPGIVALPDGSPLPEGKLTMWRELQPKDRLIKERYNSVTEVLQAIDKNGNGYISVGEALWWVNWLRWETGPKILAGPDPDSEKIVNLFRGDNLSAASELYFGDYRPKELKQN